MPSGFKSWFVTFIVFVLVLAGCASPAAVPSAPAAPGEDTAPAPAGEPRSGGSLTVGMNSDLLSFDAFSLNFASYPMQLQCYDRLIIYDEVLNIIPQLATDWEVNEEGTELTLTLREGVLFHNGREFVADDVVQNFDRALVPDTGSNVHGMVQPVDYAEALDDYTVVIHFDAPTPNMFDILNAMSIMAPESFDALSNECIGTGPFVLQEWIPGDRVTFTRNEDYWAEGLPYLDEVVLRPYSDLEAMTTALEANVIDAAIAVPPADYDRLTGAGVEVPFGQTGALLYVATLNPPDASQPEGPLSDKLVRQAICWAFDREAMIDQTLFGIGEPTVLHFPTYSLAYMEDLADYYTFDLDMAAQLLDEAGWVDSDGSGIRDKDGQELILRTITPTSAPMLTDMAQVLQNDLNTIGVELSIEPLEPPVYTARRFGQETGGTGDYDVDFTFVGRQHLDPLGLFDNSGFRPFSSPVWPEEDFPEGYVENISIAQSTIDEDTRREAFRAVQEIMLDECTSVAISWRYTLFAHQSDVYGLDWTVNDEIRLVETWTDR